jgi:hypothetical protein
LQIRAGSRAAQPGVVHHGSSTIGDRQTANF